MAMPQRAIIINYDIKCRACDELNVVKRRMQ